MVPDDGVPPEGHASGGMGGRAEAAEAEFRRVTDEADEQIAALRERAARAEGEAAGLRQSLQAAEDARLIAEGRAAQEATRAAAAAAREEEASRRAEAAEADLAVALWPAFWRRWLGR